MDRHGLRGNTTFGTTPNLTSESDWGDLAALRSMLLKNQDQINRLVPALVSNALSQHRAVL